MIAQPTEEWIQRYNEVYRSLNKVETKTLLKEFTKLKKEALKDFPNTYEATLACYFTGYLNELLGNNVEAKSNYKLTVDLSDQYLEKPFDDYPFYVKKLYEMEYQLRELKNAESTILSLDSYYKEYLQNTADQVLYYNDVALYYFNISNNKQAINFYNQAVDLIDKLDSFSIQNETIIHLNRGLAKYDERLFKEAAKDILFYLNNSKNIEDLASDYSAYVRLVGIAQYEGDYLQAAVYGDSVYTICIKQFGKESLEYIRYLMMEIETNRLLGNVDEGLSNAQELMSIYPKLGATEIDMAQVHGLKGLVYVTDYQIDKAIKEFLYADSVYKANNTCDFNCNSNLNNLGDAYQKAGQYEKAREYYLEHEKNLKEIPGSTTLEFALINNNLGLVAYFAGELNEAQTRFNQSEEFFKEANHLNHPLYAVLLNNEAELSRMKGNYKQAVDLATKSLGILEKVHGKEHVDYLRQLNNLAINYQMLGEYQIAIDYLEQTLKTLKKIHKDSTIYYAKYCSNLGQLRLSLGDYENALFNLKTSVETYAFTGNSAHPDALIAYNNMGKLLADLRQYKEAEKVYSTSLQLAQQALPATHPIFSTLYNNLGDINYSLGNQDLAEEYMKKALSFSEKIYTKNHPDYALALANYARVVENRNLKEAINIIEESLSIIENYPETNNGLRVTMLNNYLMYLKEDGQLEKQREVIVQANKLLWDEIERVFKYSSENEKKAYLGIVKHYFEVYQGEMIAGLDTTNAFIELNYKNQFKLKELLLNTSKDAFLELESLNEVRINELLQERVMLKALTNESDVLQEGYQQNKSRLNEIEADLLKEHRKHFEQNHFLEVTTQDIVSKLREKDVLVEFARHQVFENGKWKSDHQYVAYIVSKEEAIKVVPLFLESELLTLLKSEGANYLYSSRGDAFSKENSHVYLGDSISSLILQKVIPFIINKDQLYIVPDGILHQVPFAALQVDNQLLIDKYKLVQLSSSNSLVQGLAQPVLSEMTLIGGVNYDGNEKSDSLASWSYLRGAEQEVESINKLAKQHKIESHLIEHKEATEELFQSFSGNSPKVLHVSTHGFYEPYSIEVKNMVSEAQDPMNRSGILMAGANQYWLKKKELFDESDGIILAAEIANLNLSNTELAVLSACETGLGLTDGSEGVYGLQRAFKMAGVQQLLISLWKVPDAETAEFMLYFYDSWINNNDVYAAFRATQIFMSKKYPNEPVSWAGFVLIQ